MFETEFLAAAGKDAYRESVARAVDVLLSAVAGQPYSGKAPAELAALFSGELAPRAGRSAGEVWEQVRAVIGHSVSLVHPRTLAHLHCPPLVAALAAEVVISALNQSMDSFDQAPAATMLEQAVCRWLCHEAGFDDRAGAVFTAGGTQSNFMGMLLARDECIRARWNWPVQQKGLPPKASRLRFLCSEAAHFSVQKSAYQLGLGRDAVVQVAMDSAFRMRPQALEQALAQCDREQWIPAAIVATAGTTDFGSIDPLDEIAPLAQRARAWLHVDAAYGASLLFSHKHREMLRGMERADSVSVDFHKKFWQPISCAAFVLRDAGHFRLMEVHADYLNPEAHEQLGVPNLVTRSLATTRRFDALKLWLSLQLVGRDKLGAMIDQTFALAAHAAGQIRGNPAFELLHDAQMGCVVFRYVPARSGSDSDGLNLRLRQRLFDRGAAVIGFTRVNGKQCLKLTCMNPMTTEADLDALLETIAAEGRHIEEVQAESRDAT